MNFNLTDKDVKFLKVLKQQGVGAEEAYDRLQAVKSKLGVQSSTPDDIPSPMENPKIKEFLKKGTIQGSVAAKMLQMRQKDPVRQVYDATIEAENEKNSQIQNMMDSGDKHAAMKLAMSGSRKALEELPGKVVTSIGQTIGGVGNVVGGLGKAGVNTLIGDNEQASEGLKQAEQGLSDTLGGAVGAVGAVPSAIIETAPLPQEAKAGLGALFSIPTATLKSALTEGAKATNPDFDENDPDWQRHMELLENAVNAGMLFYGGVKTKKIGKDPVKAESTLVPNATTNKFKKAGEKIYEATLPKTAREAELVQNFEAGKVPNKPITIGETAARQNITGSEKTIGVKAVKAGDKLYNEKVKPALQNSSETITKQELFSVIEKKIQNTKEPGRKSDLQTAFDAIKEEYKSPEFDNMKLDFAQEIKSGLDEFTPSKAWKGQEIGSAYQQLRNDMADGIRTKTYEKLSDVNIKQDYLDLTNLKYLEKIGIEARTNVGLKKGFGGFWSTVFQKSATPLGTKAGQFLYKIGDLKISSPVKIRNLTDYLSAKGISQEEFLLRMGVGDNAKQ